MPHRRLVLPVGLVILASAWCSIHAGEVVRFLAPRDGEVLMGVTTFRFDVDGSSPPVARVDLYVDGRLTGSARAPEWELDAHVPEGLQGIPIRGVAFSGDGRLLGTAGITSGVVPYLEREHVDLVQLYPVVTRRGGSYVSGLSAEDFEIFDNGQPVPVKHFATSVASLSISLLLDSSGSMTGKLGHVQAASSRFVDLLDDLDEVGVYAFNHSSSRLTDPTRDHEMVKDRIWQLRPEGGTALYDAILRVIAELGGVRGRKAVFVFSDGVDKHSLSTLERVVRTANDNGVILYAVGAGQDDASVDARKDLRTLARESGGQAHFIRRVRDLDAAFASILEHLRSQYVLSYEPPAGEDGLRTIEVLAGGGRYDVRCRRNYTYRSSD